MNALLVSIITFWNDLKDRASGEKGATATEYALLIGLIAVAIIGGVTLLGGNINTLFNNIANKVGGIVVP